MADDSGAFTISVDMLEKSYGLQTILDKATLSICEGDRIGLVGSNGCGKSTFMKILAGVETPDLGDVVRRKGLIIGYLPQEFKLDDSLTVKENVIGGASRTAELVKEYETLPHDSNRAHEMEARITQLDGWNLENRAETLISQLKCPLQDSPVAKLSGGEKRRVALASALCARPDLLLLDEPTNHLDTELVGWLESFMREYKGACMFITHDRYFLDRVCTRIVELDGGVMRAYRGNYSSYLTEKAAQLERDDIAESKRQKFLKKELEWVRRGPKARTTKAQFRVNRYYDMSSQDGPEKRLDVDLVIPPALRLGNQVVSMEDVSMSFGDRTLFSGFNLEITPGTRLGVIGPNGIGKSTLVKLMLGQLAPSSGKVKVSHNTKFNYVDQERLQLDDSKSVLEEIGEGYDHVMLGEERVTVWTYLKRFLFTDERIRTKVGCLSGGERARLLLAKILKRGGNFIVLDEPTNDLDLSTLRLLEDALVGFDGCVMLVSHDRYFLNRVCTGIIAFEADGTVFNSPGDYDYYISTRGDKFRRIQERKKSQDKFSAVSSQETAPKARKLKWKEQQELDSMESAILKAEEAIEKANAILLSPDFYKESPEKAGEVHSELLAAQARRDKLYARWAELDALKNGNS